MKIKWERIKEILVVNPEGRLDAFEAFNLDKELKTLLQEEDRYLVLDLAGVPYLSSGGLRVFLSAHKTLAGKGGRLFLCGLTEYPVQVIKMAGMDSIFTTCETANEAVNQVLLAENRARSEKDLSQLPCYHRNKACFSVFRATENQARLKIAGSLMKVMHATLEPEDVLRRRFSETEYSIGLGALGGSLEDCLPLLGEMMTIGGTMVWLPTDGNDTPDFLIPQKDTGEVLIHTGLNLALEGEFNDIILVEPEEGCRSITLSEFYDSVFDIARERQVADRSLASVAMVADLEALFSSGIKISPLKKNTPVNNGLITDPENIAKWMDINADPRHEGQTMVSFGLGLDLTSDFSGLPKTCLDNVFYLHPSNVGSKKMLLHNHGVVFQSLGWQNTLDLDTKIQEIVRQGEFVDMRHLLDTTRITRAVAGVSYIADIRVE